MLRVVVLLSAVAMPAVAWFSNRGYFGPTNAEISSQYPTLIVAAGYAFAIWGVIFLLAVALGLQQLIRKDALDARTRAVIAVGYLLSASWMIVFAALMFWTALAVIWVSWACLLYAAIRAHDAGPGLARWALGMHAGWLSLAIFLNTAQVVVAFEIFSTTEMLGWTLALFGMAAVTCALALVRTNGMIAYAIPVIWGLAAVYVKQSQSSLAGADTAGLAAATLAVGFALATGWLKMRDRMSPTPAQT